MRYLASIVIWVMVLGIGGFVGYAIHEDLGAIVGIIVAQLVMATIIPGPRYPGDTNYYKKYNRGADF